VSSNASSNGVALIRTAYGQPGDKGLIPPKGQTDADDLDHD
jgi:hypothetical protein